jgi:SPP1 gp7 family putative phage head morphogenesis protein
MSVREVAEAYKERLLVSERRVASQLVRAYALASSRIEERARALLTEIDELRAGGAEVSSSYLYERDRLARLQADIGREMNRFARVGTARTALAVDAASALGRENGQALVRVAAPRISLGGLDARASAQMAARVTARSTHLSALFNRLGPLVSERVSNELVAGIAEGAGVRVVAARIRQASGLGLSRALTISRTETVNAYRDATMDVYRSAPAGVVTGWKWLASESERTCPFCRERNGRTFPLAEKMRSHPNCRCTSTPVTASA